MSFYEKGPVRIHYEEAGSGFPLWDSMMDPDTDGPYPGHPDEAHHEAYTFFATTRRTVSLQSVGNLWAPTASDFESPADLDRSCATQSARRL